MRPSMPTCLELHVCMPQKGFYKGCCSQLNNLCIINILKMLNEQCLVLCTGNLAALTLAGSAAPPLSGKTWMAGRRRLLKDPVSALSPGPLPFCISDHIIPPSQREYVLSNLDMALVH